MLTNRQQTCAIFGWTAREFDRNVALGLPAKKRTSSRGETWQVDTVAAIGWTVAQAVGEQGGNGAGSLDLNAERARLLRSQANLSELEEGKRRGELIPGDQVLAAWQQSIGRARSLLLSLPAAAAGELMLVFSRGEGTVRERLRDLIFAALAELSETDPLADDDEGEDEGQPEAGPRAGEPVA